jgi:hypothetical protein
LGFRKQTGESAMLLTFSTAGSDRIIDLSSEEGTREEE